MAKRKRPTDEKQKETMVELGFGGLLKGLGDFVDILGEMVDKGEQLRTRTGEFRVKGLGEEARGVYGVSVRVGLGGEPRIERFGNIRATEQGPEVAEVREPLVDVFDEAKEIIVVAELPGVAEAEIDVDVQGDILSLATTGEHRYAKEILLARAVDPTSLRKSYRNGILELRLKKA